MLPIAMSKIYSPIYQAMVPMVVYALSLSV